MPSQRVPPPPSPQPGGGCGDPRVDGGRSSGSAAADVLCLVVVVVVDVHVLSSQHLRGRRKKEKQKKRSKKNLSLPAINLCPIHDEALPPPLASCPRGRQRVRCFPLCTGSCARCCPRMRTRRGAKANEEEIHARMAFLCQQGTHRPGHAHGLIMPPLMTPLMADFDFRIMNTMIFPLRPSRRCFSRKML